MPYLIPDPALARTRCEIVHLDADPLGVRLVQMPTSPLVLFAAPWARLPELIAGLGVLRVAAYILCGSSYPEGNFTRLYIGESESVSERLRKHARDPRKSFASLGLVLTSRDANLSKHDVEAIQHILDRNAEAADRGQIVRGKKPIPPPIDGAAWARAEAMVAQARFLLASAGCWLLEPRIPAETVSSPGASVVERVMDRVGSGRASAPICPPAVPVPEPRDEALSPDVASRTYLLQRGGLRALASERAGRVSILAGSEVARTAIASCDPSTSSRRQALAAAGLLAAVPGRRDRWKLLRDTPVSSLTGAARILTGSHCAGSAWQLLPDGVPA